MKKILLCMGLLLLFTGCDKKVSQKEYEDLVSKYQELNEDYATIKKDYDALKLELVNVTDYKVDFINHVAYHVPSEWKTQSENDTIYYYPKSGMLMVQRNDVDNGDKMTSVEIDELLSIYEDGISTSSSEYEKISSELIYVDSNIVAQELSFYSNYGEERYESKAVTFIFDDSLYTFVFAQPKAIKDSDIFQNIIESIVTIE